MSKSLREVWESKGPNIGGWCTVPSAFSAELMGRAGYDWVCVDTQHGLIGHDQMATMLATVAIAGTPTFVRVAWNQPDHIMKALDAKRPGHHRSYGLQRRRSPAGCHLGQVPTARHPLLGTHSSSPSASTTTPQRTPTAVLSSSR